MKPDARDDLILRHLEGETEAAEQAQVKRLLAEDDHFRKRFFAFVGQVARLREMLGGGNGMSNANGNITEKPRPVAQEESTGAKIDIRQIYFNAVMGGIGGLLGWASFYLLSTIPFFIDFNIYVKQAINGALLGICIGAAIGSTEGILASRSWRGILHGTRYGAGLGAVGGLIGLTLGELVFHMGGGGIYSRSIGWAIFGMFVGTSDGFALKMPSKIRYGILGGLLGGLVGGSTYQGLISVLGGNSTGLAWGGAIGLIILGACIGALIGLVESLLRQSWLWFMTGRLEGQTRTLDSSRPHTLGSADTCSIVIPNDPQVAPIHAQVSFANEQFVINAMEGDVILKRDGRDKKITTQALQPGDRIQIGETKMVFRNEAGKQRPIKPSLRPQEVKQQ